MSCIWDKNLHRQRVDRSNRHSQKQFLHLDHWTQPPKSREHDKHIWSVVRLRFGPVAASLNNLIDLLWRTKASHSTSSPCTQLIAIQDTITLSPLKKHMQNDMHQQIKGHVPLTSVHQFGSIKHHLDLFMLLLSNTIIKPQRDMYIVSFHDSTHLTYLTRILHHGCY